MASSEVYIYEDGITLGDRACVTMIILTSGISRAQGLAAGGEERPNQVTDAPGSESALSTTSTTHGDFLRPNRTTFERPPLQPFRKLQRFAGFSGVRRRLFVEAAFELTRGQLAAALIPFRWLTPRFGMLMAESPEIYNAAHQRAILDIRWAIGTAACQLPWHCRCLVRATAAKWMLRRRRIPSTLYLGVAPGATKPWDAHAWVRCLPPGSDGLEVYVVGQPLSHPLEKPVHPPASVVA